MSRSVGIDLGTTNSVIATIERGRPLIVPNREGGRLTPSAVSIAGARRTVGSKARAEALIHPERTVLSVKRLMGEDVRIDLGGEAYTPQEISAMILGTLKEDAESFLEEPVEKAVITVPAYFNDAQRQATRDAGALAGLEVARVLNEPTAAALAYGLDREDVETAMIWDLGGGTFDVSILEMGEGVFEVRAVSGNTRLGGDDYDRRVMEFVAEECRAATGVDLRRDPVMWQGLREAAERAKIELSIAETATVRLAGCPSFARVLTRAELEAACAELTRMLLAPARRALADARMEPADIDRVILVGGSTRMPAVRRAVEELMGAAPYVGLNPDEVVAIGAAVQAGILNGEIAEIVLVDVTPLSLGIRTLGGLFTRLIPRNTPIPASTSQIFTTAEDDQAAVDVHILQGEREMAADNMSLGVFTLDGIPPRPRGQARVEVSFRIDADGIVHVAAADLQTESERGVRVNGAARLCRQDVARMVRDASVCAGNDRRRREDVEVRIEADGLVRAARLSLAENSGRAEAGQWQALSAGLNELESLLAEADGEAVRRGVAALKACMRRFHGAVRHAD